MASDSTAAKDRHGTAAIEAQVRQFRASVPIGQTPTVVELLSSLQPPILTNSVLSPGSMTSPAQGPGLHTTSRCDFSCHPTVLLTAHRSQMWTQTEHFCRCTRCLHAKRRSFCHHASSAGRLLAFLQSRRLQPGYAVTHSLDGRSIVAQAAALSHQFSCKTARLCALRALVQAYKSKRH